MTERRPLPGDVVSIPWGIDEIYGVVEAFYGPPGRVHALVAVKFDDDSDESEVISFPVDILTVAETVR